MPNRNQVLLIISNDVYEVRKFIPNHPGEGISNIYLKEWSNSNVTEQFEKFHYTDTSMLWLNEAKEKGYISEGIYYVGEIGSFFHKKIPEWFFYFQTEKDLETFVSAAEPKSFLVTQRDNSSVFFVTKDEKNQITKKVLSRKDKIWSLESDSSVTDSTLEGIVARLSNDLKVM